MSHNVDADGPGGGEKINVDIVTLTRFLNEEQAKHKEATGDFTYVVLFDTRRSLKLTIQTRLLCHALQFSFKSIAYYIRRATLINVRVSLCVLSTVTNNSP